MSDEALHIAACESPHSVRLLPGGAPGRGRGQERRQATDGQNAETRRQQCGALHRTSPLMMVPSPLAAARRVATGAERRGGPLASPEAVTGHEPGSIVA